MSVKKVLLQKKLESTVYDLYPKTEASIVVYERTYTDNDGDHTVATTVSAELARLASQGSDDLTAAKDYTDTQVAALQSAIEGLGDNETLVSAFDTLKEIGDWLANAESTNAATIIADVTDLKTKVGNAAVAQVGEVGDANYVAPVAATGLYLTIDGIAARVAALEAIDPVNVVDSVTNGYITVDGAEVEVYDDTELRNRLGHAYIAAQGTEGEADYVAAQASTGVFALIDSINAEIGADNSANTIKGRISALETLVGHAADSGASPAVEATGLFLAIDTLEATVNALTTVVYTATAPTAASALTNKVYIVELD